MDTVNMRKVDDPFYRYRMAAVNVVVLPANRTQIVNLSDISRDIGRSPDIIMKFVCRRLGTGCNGSVIRGVFTSKQIQTIIYDFVEEKVVCKHCDNPETLETKGKIVCRACGGK